MRANYAEMSGGDVHEFDWAIAFENEIEGKNLNVDVLLQEWDPYM